MKSVIRIFSLITIILFSLTGCNNKLTDTATVAKQYLEDQGYTIIGYEEQSESYNLTKSKLKQSPYDIIWSIKGNDPTPYMNKLVVVENFIVENHPLSNWENDGVKSNGKVSVYVYVIEGKVIGGTSTPVIPQTSGLVGGWYPLDGNTN